MIHLLMASKIRYFNFMSYFSQKSRMSELTDLKSQSFQLNNTYLVDEVPEAQRGIGICPTSHSR